MENVFDLIDRGYRESKALRMGLKKDNDDNGGANNGEQEDEDASAKEGSIRVPMRTRECSNYI